MKKIMMLTRNNVSSPCSLESSWHGAVVITAIRFSKLRHICMDSLYLFRIHPGGQASMCLKTMHFKLIGYYKLSVGVGRHTYHTFTLFVSPTVDFSTLFLQHLKHEFNAVTFTEGVLMRRQCASYNTIIQISQALD